MRAFKFASALLCAAILLTVAACASTAPAATPVTVVQTVEVPKQVEVTRVVPATGAPVTAAPATPVPPTAAATKPAQPGADQVVNITWWGTERGRDTAATRELHSKLAQAFEKTHPKTKVAVSLFPSRGFSNRVLTAISAGQGPDVWYDFYATDAASQGFLEDLTPYLQASNVDPTKRWFPIGQVRANFNGKYFGVPRDATAGFIVYNKDMYDAAGLAYPKEGWTVAEYRNNAIKLTNRDKDQYGAGSIEGSVGCFQWSSFSFNLGADFVSPDGKQVAGFMDTPQAIKAIKWCLDLTATDKVTPPQALSDQFGETTFVSGKVAMEHVSTWELPAIREKKNIKWGVVSPPRADENTKEIAWTDSYVFYISSKSAQKQRAWEFLEWITGPEAGKQIAESGVWTPALPAVWQDQKWPDDPILSVPWKELGKETRVPNYLRSQYYFECVGPAFDAFWSQYVEKGNRELDKLVKDEVAKAQACLDKNYKK